MSMNYKKIAKFIKDTRTLTIWNGGGMQYITNGIAVYPVYGMPRMNEAEMLNFLGLADKASVITTKAVTAPDWLIELKYDECIDSILESNGPGIILHGDLFRTYYSEEGAVVVQNSYISAVEGSFDKDYPISRCMIDIGQKHKCIAIFAGFDIYGIVMPMETQELYREYYKLADQLKLANEKQDGSHEEDEE